MRAWLESRHGFRSRLVLVALVMLGATVPAWAQTPAIDLTWNANSESDLAGYRVYVGSESGSYSQSFDIPANSTTYRYVNPAQNSWHFFAITAFNTAGMESGRSNEVSTWAGSPDTVLPSITITSPSGSVTVTNGTLALAGTASDNVRVAQVSWSNSRGGSGTASGTTAWGIAGVSLQGGSNVITVTARDAYGNTRQASVTVTYNAPDTTQPSVTISSPANNANITTPNVTVSGTASDNIGVTSVTWSNNRGGNGTATGTTSWSASVPLATGANIITITASDAANNTRTATRTVNGPDTTSPTITVTAPANGATIAAANIGVAGTASDNVGVTQVSWSNSRGGSGNATGTTSWSVANVPLQSGANVITLTARDAAGNTDQASITVNYSRMTGASIASSIASPQTPNTPVTFTASGSGGVAPYQYRWYMLDGGGVWRIVRDFSTSATYSWTPASSGNYTFAVWARSAGSTVVEWEAYAERPFSIAAAAIPPVSSVQLTANRTSPQVTLTPITFTASPTGGAAPVQYKWFVQPTGGSQQMLRDWSTTTTQAWTPVAPGSYTVTVWARSAGVTTNAAQAQAQSAFTINDPSSARMTSAALAVDLASPQDAGTTVTFSASGTGGSGPYQYCWYLLDRGTWRMVRDFSTNDSLAWTPSAGGSYTMAIWARSAGNTRNEWEAYAERTYVVSSAGIPPATSVDLSANRTTPQVTGTAVTFTAGAAGGAAPYQYKWFAQASGGSMQTLRDWNASSTFTWTPTTAASYTITVWARSNGVTDNAAQASDQTSFTITAPGGSARMTGASLAVDRTSPQPTGTAITFTASGTGGSTPYEYKWFLLEGATWRMVREWNAAPTLTWTPTAVGNYTMAIWARSNGATANEWQAYAERGFVINAGGTTIPPVSSVQIAGSHSSPQVPGTTVTFTGAGNGGATPYQYKWFVQANGGSLQLLSDWSASPTVSWTPSSANTYTITVWARSNGVATDAAQASSQTTFVTSTPSGGGSRMTGASLTRSPGGFVGVPLTFTASGSGGSAPYQFKWFINQGGVWNVLQDWSPMSSLTWMPVRPGSYTVAIWGRSAGATADAWQAYAETTFSVTPDIPRMTGANLTANLASPQAPGTPITFTAAGSGGAAPYEYKWFVFDGSAWRMVRDWSTTTTLDWTPAARGTYTIAIWSRSRGVTFNEWQAYDEVNFTIQ